MNTILRGLTFWKNNIGITLYSMPISIMNKGSNEDELKKGDKINSET